ncbi:MAG: hypothetical protein F4Y22_11910 [Gammaproteobacteria bacterium]|nr:hypothetical protein [Gammaproteobacteria bacterium]MYH47208.1 hypothetical protein [Gammaproteobacteria bacterium]MYL13066.1 hypothetical protein [Gammaproteobacteria bacterium]
MRRVRPQSGEGLRLVRLLMVLSSLCPLFVLMAIRGNSLFPELYFVMMCLALAIVPSIFLWLRVRTVQLQDDVRKLVVGQAEDHRSHVLVYLFATLLPFYREELGSIRDLLAMCIALGLIIFLFWRLNLHYLNVFFAFRGYFVFTVSPPESEKTQNGLDNFVLITKRKKVREGQHIIAFRLSNTVYLEKSI